MGLYEWPQLNCKDFTGPRSKTPTCRRRMGGLHFHGRQSTGISQWAQILLLWNTDPSQPDTYRGQSPVALAAMNGHRDTVRLLLENSGDAWKKDNDGHTALNSTDMHNHNKTPPSFFWSWELPGSPVLKRSRCPLCNMDHSSTHRCPHQHLFA